MPGASTDTGCLHDVYWQGQTDRHREPMALVDATGRIIRTTPAFDDALRNRDGAGAALMLTAGGTWAGGTWAGGTSAGGTSAGVPGTAQGTEGQETGKPADGTGQRLRAAIAVEQPVLDAAIARAVRAIAPVAAAVRCPRRDGGAAVIVTLRPIPRWTATPGRVARAGAAAATLTLIDPLARPPAATTLWREAFDLTPSEAAVAALLVAGHSLESAAASRGSRATTLRVHLRHLFAKTGTARQSDLVALLLRMG